MLHLSPLALALLASGNPRVAVLVSAPTAADAGELERVLRVRLSSAPGLVLVPATALAAAVGVDEPAPTVDPDTRRKADGLWATAHKEYVEGRYPAALKALDQLEPLLLHLPSAEHVRAHTLAAAVHSKLEDVPSARREATEALVIGWDKPLDLSEFPPSVAKVFQSTQAEMKHANLTIEGIPPGAELSVDDHPFPGLGALPLGRHRLRVKAKAFRILEREVDLQHDQVIPVSVPPALDKTTEALVASACGSPVVSDDLKRSLGRLAIHLDVDVLVLALRTVDAKRAAVWWSTPAEKLEALGAFSLGPDGDGSLAERVASELGGGGVALRAGAGPVQGAGGVAEAATRGETDAAYRSVAGWGWGAFGSSCLLPLVGPAGVAVVGYSATPTVAPVCPTCGEDYNLAYQQSYTKKLKRRRGGAAVVGGVIGTVIITGIIIAASNPNGL